MVGIFHAIYDILLLTFPSVMDASVWINFTFVSLSGVSSNQLIPKAITSLMVRFSCPRFLQRIVKNSWTRCHCPLSLYNSKSLQHNLDTETPSDAWKKGMRTISFNEKSELQKIVSSDTLSQCMVVTLDVSTPVYSERVVRFKTQPLLPIHSSLSNSKCIIGRHNNSRNGLNELYQKIRFL